MPICKVWTEFRRVHAGQPNNSTAALCHTQIPEQTQEARNFAGVEAWIQKRDQALIVHRRPRGVERDRDAPAAGRRAAKNSRPLVRHVSGKADAL